MKETTLLSILKDSCKESDQILQLLNIVHSYRDQEKTIKTLYNTSKEKRNELGNILFVQPGKNITDIVIDRNKPYYSDETSAKHDAINMIQTINLATLAYHIVCRNDYTSFIHDFFKLMETTDDQYMNLKTKSYFQLRYSTLPTVLGDTNVPFGDILAQGFMEISSLYREGLPVDHQLNEEKLFDYELIQYCKEKYRAVQKDRVDYHKSSYRSGGSVSKYVIHIFKD